MKNLLQTISLALLYFVACNFSVLAEPEKSVKKEIQINFKDLLLLSEEGDADAQFSLGKMYESGKNVAQDIKQAAKWFRKSAENGHVEAQLSLGMLYYVGDGVPQDKQQTIEWVLKAAKQGHPYAQGFLGDLYYMNYMGTQREEEAVKWYLKSAEQGYAYGQGRLAYMYEYGLGTSKDIILAYMWLKIAKNNGWNKENRLRKLAKEMNPRQISEAEQKVQSWLQKNR